MEEAEVEQTETPMPAEDEKAHVERVKELFQKSYKILYSGEKFDSVVEHVESAGVVEGVTAIIVALVNSMIKDSGETDPTTVFSVAIMLMGDILESLQELGIEADEQAGQEILTKGVPQVLEANPEFAQKVMADPATQEMLQGAQEEQPQAQPQQGVL